MQYSEPFFTKLCSIELYKSTFENLRFNYQQNKNYGTKNIFISILLVAQTLPTCIRDDVKTNSFVRTSIRTYRYNLQY